MMIRGRRCGLGWYRAHRVAHGRASGLYQGMPWRWLRRPTGWATGAILAAALDRAVARKVTIILAPVGSW